MAAILCILHHAPTATHWGTLFLFSTAIQSHHPQSSIPWQPRALVGPSGGVSPTSLQSINAALGSLHGTHILRFIYSYLVAALKDSNRRQPMKELSSCHDKHENWGRRRLLWWHCPLQRKRLVIPVPGQGGRVTKKHIIETTETGPRASPFFFPDDHALNTLVSPGGEPSLPSKIPSGIGEDSPCSPRRSSLTRPPQAKIEEWLQSKTRYLHAILRRESPPQETPCTACESSVTYRCRSCFSRQPVYRSYLVSRHVNAFMQSVANFPRSRRRKAFPQVKFLCFVRRVGV